jgi:hypothetical protein
MRSRPPSSYQPGPTFLIRANETIDSSTADEGRVYAGTVDQDILDSAGTVAVRKGSKAELLVREVEPKKKLVLDLQSLIVNGRRHFVNANDYDAMHSSTHSSFRVYKNLILEATPAADCRSTSADCKSA